MPNSQHVRALVAAIATAIAFAAAAPSAGIAPARAVHPVPQSRELPAARGLDALVPPTTADCLAAMQLRCYVPAQIQRAYDAAPLLARGIDGSGRTIVLIDPFGSPTIREDLTTFDRAFGLPDPPSFRILQPVGVVPPFPADPLGIDDRLGWAGETTLDVEYAHVLAPGASIVLVETPVTETEGVQGFPEIVRAENFVIDRGIGDVISQSFGATEQTFPSARSIIGLRTAVLNAFVHHVTVLAGSGDSGAGGLLPDQSCCFPFPAVVWPASDPLVTAVGGTQIQLDANGDRLAPDTVWNGAGGGVSAVFPRPPFQAGVRAVTGRARGIPDVSMNAGVDGEVVVFASYPNALRPSCPGPDVPCPRFTFQAGTSESGPLFAGVVALADQLAGRRLGLLNDRLYDLAARHVPGIVDVTSGDNTTVFCASACGTDQEQETTVTGFVARPGFDLASGVGTVDAGRLVPALAHR